MIKHIFLLSLIILSAHYSFAQKANHETDSLLKVLPSITDDSINIYVLNEIAYAFSADATEEATRYANRALALSEKIRSDGGRINSYNILGLVQYYQSNYDKALEYHRISLELCKKTKNKSKEAIALNNIGLVYDDKGDYKPALEYYIQALKLAEETGNKRLLASALNNSGLIYKKLGRFDDALDYMIRSLKIKEEIGNRKGMSSSYHNIAMIYAERKEYSKSLDYYDKALQIRKELSDISGTALTLNNIGGVYESMQQYDKAYPYFVEALNLRKDLKDRYNECISIFSLGGNYCNRGQIDKGLEYMQQALSMAQQLGAKDLVKFGYQALALAYEKQKNYEKAYEYEKLLLNLKDSILNVESAKELNEMQTKYETEKKQKEIELLTKDSEIQALQLNKNKLWMIVLCAVILLIIMLAALLYNRYIIKQRANTLLEHRNTEITLQKKEITDSINYAKRIQESILPPVESWNKMLPDSFIFYRPKDIVSGDFYWIEQKGDTVCFAAVDCTGHGVPGALMSVVGFNLLTQAINEVNLLKPSDILKHLDAGVTKTLRQSEEGKGVKDGMDLSICSLNTGTLELQYAGAFNSLYYIANGTLHEIKADKFPIGVNLDGKVDDYTNHTIQLKKGDCVYLYSDGYADQFGGPKGKKFKYDQLKQLLTRVYRLPVDEQRKAIEDAFDQWKGELDQVDDVVIIGVRV